LLLVDQVGKFHSLKRERIVLRWGYPQRFGGNQYLRQDRKEATEKKGFPFIGRKEGRGKAFEVTTTGRAAAGAWRTQPEATRWWAMSRPAAGSREMSFRATAS
jgi:hypothetical protein